MRIIALDTETPTSNNDDICEIGIAVIENGEIVETRDWLIRPFGNVYYQKNIDVHGIKPQDTENSPTFGEMYHELERYFLKCDAIIAHNATFDMNVIKKTMKRFNIQAPSLYYMCSRDIGRTCYCGESSFTLEHLCNVNQIDLGIHHRADYDALSCAKLFLCEMKTLNYSLPEMINSFGRAWDDIDLTGFIPSMPVKSLRRIQNEITKEFLEEISNIECENPNTLFYSKTICFTGEIGCDKKEASILIARCGGRVHPSVTSKLDILVIGPNPCGGESGKLKKAKEYNQKGKANIELMDAEQFIALCELIEKR